MSRIYFHTREPELTVEIPGSIRYGVRELSRDVFLDELASSGVGLERLLTFLGYTWNFNQQMISAWIGSFEERPFAMNGIKYDVDTAISNTMIATGDDYNIFLMRLHNQCEINLWVGDDRLWLADRVEGFLGKPHTDSLEKVVETLRKTEHPVVLSYSVCEPFPDPYIMRERQGIPYDEEDEEEIEKFYDLPHEEQFDQAFEALKNSDPLMEIRKDMWYNYFFGKRVTARDIIDYVSATG